MPDMQTLRALFNQTLIHASFLFSSVYNYSACCAASISAQKSVFLLLHQHCVTVWPTALKPQTRMSNKRRCYWIDWIHERYSTVSRRLRKENMSTGSLGNEIVCLSETRSPSSWSLPCLLHLHIPAFLRHPAMAAGTESTNPVTVSPLFLKVRSWYTALLEVWMTLKSKASSLGQIVSREINKIYT